MAEAVETDEGEDVHHGVGDGGTGMPTSKGTRLKMANRVNICLKKKSSKPTLRTFVCVNFKVLF